METLSDILAGVNETFGIFEPFVAAARQADVETLAYETSKDSEELREPWKEVMRRGIASQTASYDFRLERMDETQKALVELLAFGGKKIRRFSLTKDKEPPKADLYVTFEDGVLVYASNYGSNQITFSIQHDFDISPGHQPAFRLEYEVNPSAILACLKLEADEIPKRLFLPAYAQEMIKYSKLRDRSERFGETVEDLAVIHVNSGLSREAVPWLQMRYSEIQRRLAGITGRADDHYVLTVEHEPADEFPVHACCCYYPVISDKSSPTLLNTPISRITDRFGELESAVKSLYQPMDIAGMERHVLRA